MTQEIEGQTRGGQPQENRADSSLLPDLRMTKIAESANRVVSDQLKPNDTFVQPHGEYTIVVGGGIDEIQIYDVNAQKIENLANTNTLIFNWDFFRTNCTPTDGKYMVSSLRSAAGRKSPQYRDYIEHYTKDIYGSELLSIPRGNLSLTEQDLLAKTEDRFIVLQDQASSQFIAFQTRSDEGVDLPPRNWKRFDAINSYSLPEKIREAVEVLRTTPNETPVGAVHFIVNKDRVFVKLGEAEIFNDNIPGIENVAIDPKDSNVVYFCNKDYPKNIFKLDLNGLTPDWQTEPARLPQDYAEIRNFQLDPSGNFFTFQSGQEFIILAKDDLSEIKRIQNIHNAKLDQRGMIKGIDENAHLVIYDPHFEEVITELEKKRVHDLTKGLADKLFKTEVSTQGDVFTDRFEHLEPQKVRFEAVFNEKLEAINNLDDIPQAYKELERLRSGLKSGGLKPNEIDFITGAIKNTITAREQVLAAPIIAKGLEDLGLKIGENLTIASLTEAKADIAKLKSLEGLADNATRARIRELEEQLSKGSDELFRREGAVIVKDVGEMVTGVREELGKIVSMPEFSDWQEFRLPQLISRLGSLANDCPLEASDIQKNILAARRQLQEISTQYEKKFKEQYGEVRQKAAEIMGERVGLMRTDMESLLDRLKFRGFADRAQAESYVGSSDALAALRQEISELASQDPDASRELDKELKVRIANIMAEIERGEQATIAETGQQMVLFGDTLFPRWEGKVQEKVRRQVDLIFICDDKSKGPGVSADKIYGDIGIMDINSRGALEKKRLYQGMQDEDEWRYGSVSYRGEYVFPAYVTQAEYRSIKQNYADWNKGETSEIRTKLGEKRQALRDWYKQREPKGERQNDEQWRARYGELLNEYARFAGEKHVLLLSRVDQLRDAPETEFANGCGYIPEWQSHWTVDETAEHYLEEMAKASKMQLDLQEGLLNLKGHAGTGKDVLVKMFCNRSNRPYFAIDCSKWTTEFELSEDVVLEAEDGASKTVKVPSVVLNAITTPGSVMYFNEINAMPEQAQIFLHGLMDEKRTLTLKTSSGKAVRTLDSVLLMGSMNPGYPGTFNPQFATRSRMVGLEIDYPPLYREKDPNDSNPNPPINAAEALRVARQIDSLADLTYEANLDHNDFVKVWDKHVNGIDNGAPDLTPVQKFDVEAILTMVEFAQKLREGFIIKFEKRSASEIKGKLTVDQPITGREMRRMAYFLSKMSPEEKVTANPETVIRKLMEKFFLSHIDNQKERDEIKTAMASWTSSKRPAA